METVTIIEGYAVTLDKHEIVLQGPKVAKAIAEKGILDGFYQLKQLNYVNISAGLKQVPPKFGTLVNLTSLVLHGNKLEKLSSELGQLKKLKHLDVSSNCLFDIPNEISELIKLSSLNVSMNQLTSLPSFHQNVNLAYLNASGNNLKTFPDCCYLEMAVLAELLLSSNEIEFIPKEIFRLHSLKILDVGSNKISEVPPEISHLGKLKELNLKNNPLKDKRLKKMVDQCHSKKVIDYIQKNLGKQTGCHAERKESLRMSISEDEPNSKHAQMSVREVEPAQSLLSQPIICKAKYVIEIVKPEEKQVVVVVSNSVKNLRPGILCCIVRDVTFTPESFQKLIQLQNKFHDTVCDKRQKATIGTHDLKCVKSPLRYTSCDPKALEFLPLGYSEPCSPAQYYINMQKEVASIKKEKKRSYNSGIYQYLYLLEDKEEYPFLIDAEDQVISLPPLTNCEVTKLSLTTTDILVEITSKNDKKLIREIMDKLIMELAQCGIGKKHHVNTEISGMYDGAEDVITVEQITIQNEGGSKFFYPMDKDLDFPPSSDFLKVVVSSKSGQQ